jgi:hypothetical protein
MNNIVVQEQVTKIGRSYSYNDGIEDSYLLDDIIVLSKNQTIGDGILNLNKFTLNNVTYYREKLSNKKVNEMYAISYFPITAVIRYLKTGEMKYSFEQHTSSESLKYYSLVTIKEKNND